MDTSAAHPDDPALTNRESGMMAPRAPAIAARQSSEFSDMIAFPGDDASSPVLTGGCRHDQPAERVMMADTSPSSRPVSY